MAPDPTYFILVALLFGGPIALSVALARRFQPSHRNWRRLAERYGAQVDLSGCHNQDGIFMQSQATSAKGPALVGATAKGLVLKPHRLPTVEIPCIAHLKPTN